MGSREFGGGDGVAAGDLEHQAALHDGAKGEALAPDHGCDQQRHQDPDHARTPLDEAPEEVGSLFRDQQCGKDPGHEEDERVEQSESAKAAGGLLEQVERKAQRASAGGRIACRGVHEGDLMVYRGHHLR